MKTETDLFEHPEKQPEELREILQSAPEEMDYPDLENLLKQVEAIGYTFDYYLDAEPYNLRKMSIQERIEYLRGELREERISYGELVELESLSNYIDKDDVELLDALGTSKFDA